MGKNFQNNKHHQNQQPRPVVDIKPVGQAVEPQKPTIEKGNYVIQIIADGKEIKRLAVGDSEINIVKLAEGGMVIDLGAQG